ncbi:MAG: hypothetical protein P8013_02715 [Candidatus Sulfobium sp.]|jgi:hypothetical protein
MKTMTAGAGNRTRRLGGSGVPAFDFSSILRNIPTLTQVRPPKEEPELTRKGTAVSSGRKRPDETGLKNLAEAVILQSIEDLWSKTHQKESIEFFMGEGFRHCADMAEMSVVERLRIIRMLRKINAEAFTPRHTQKLARIAKSL